MLKAPEPETVYIFCYTSGTTGDPKGAMLTHRSVLATFHMIDYTGLSFNENDVCISYLPYAHAFEQIMFVQSMSRGASHGYYSGDPLLLL